MSQVQDQIACRDGNNGQRRDKGFIALRVDNNCFLNIGRRETWALRKGDSSTLSRHLKLLDGSGLIGKRLN